MKKIERLVTFVNEKLPPQRWLIWLFVAFIVKFAAFFFLINKSGGGYGGSWMLFNADTSSYFDPVINFILNGRYWDDLTEGFRMPGYGLLYYLLHFVTNSESAIFNTIGIIQTALSAIAAYMLGLLAMRIIMVRWGFYVVFLLTLCSPFNLLFNSYLLTESFSVSTLIIATYFLERFVSLRRLSACLLSSFFFLWAMFLRPNIFVISPILILFFIYLLVRKKISFIQTSVFFIPIVVAFGFWGLHNLNSHGRFNILTHSTYYPHINKSFVKENIEFFNAFGFAQVSLAFVENGEIYYYLNYPQKDVVIHIDNIDKYPVKEFNKDSIAALVVSTNRIYFDSLLTSSQKDSLNSLVKLRLASYREAFTEQYPFTFRVKNLVPILLDYVSVGATGYSGQQENISAKQLLFKTLLFLNNTLTSLVIYGGLAGCIIMLLTFVRQPFAIQAFTGGITLALFFSIPLVLRLGETRYIVPSYSFLIVGLLFLIVSIVRKTFFPFAILKKSE